MSNGQDSSKKLKKDLESGGVKQAKTVQPAKNSQMRLAHNALVTVKVG
jgi:hypothetical protein